MLSSEKKKWFTQFFVISTFILAVSVLFYVTTDFYKERHPVDRKEFDYGGRAVQPMAVTGQVTLIKNEKLVIGRTGLVFKGVDKKMFFVDLYLLDMDPEQGYTKRFLKKEAKKEMLLGDGRYRLLSVNNKFLALQKLQKP